MREQKRASGRVFVCCCGRGICTPDLLVMPTTTIFIAPPIRQICGLDYPFIPKGCLPSSLYTFPNLSGLARDYHFQASPNLTANLLGCCQPRRPIAQNTNSWYNTSMPKSLTRSLTRSDSIYKFRNPNGNPFHYNPKNNQELELIGLTLWATEGDRTQLSLSNGNLTIIKKYLEFIRKVCNFHEEKIKAVIHCHDTLPYKDCVKYWSRITEIPASRFTKPYIKKDHGGTRKYPYGIIRIAASNIKLVRIFNERLKELGFSKD